MPTGAISATTRASAAVEDNTFYTASVNPALLAAGTNVVAVEVHQRTVSDADLSFDFALTATVTPPPAAPATPTPADGSVVNATPITLDWADSAGATSYDVLLGAAGTYFATVASSQLAGFVPPADGVQLWRVVARGVGGDTPGPLWAFTIDTTPPTALFGDERPAAGAATMDLTIAYADATTAVDPSTFDGDDVLVTGPNGYSQSATFVGATAGGVVTYRIPAPGGSWNPADDGVYTIAQRAAQVSDTAGNARPAGAIGTFTADLPFAWMSGSALHVEFGDSPDAITLGASGADLTASRGGTSLMFSGAITAVDVIGTGGDDALQLDALPNPQPTLNFGHGGGNDSLRVLAGAVTFPAGLSDLAVTVDTGAAVTFASIQHLARLIVNGHASVAAGGANTLITKSLAVAGRLDIRDNALLVDFAGTVNPIGSCTGTAYDGLTGLVQSGRNGGAWNGNGIVSSLASGNLTTLGVAPVAGAERIAVKFTYGGDANLDGRITVDDYGVIDFNIGLDAVGWDHGDFNYDGTIGVDDYGVIDFNVGIQGPRIENRPAAWFSAPPANWEVFPPARNDESLVDHLFPRDADA
jgi:hypothetical protein